MKSIYLALLMLLFSGMVSAQTYTIDHNLSYTPASLTDCYSTTVLWDDGNWHSTPITVNVSHNIPNSSTVTNLNSKGWRTYEYKIWHDDNGQLSLIKTITNTVNYLLPAQEVSQLGLLDLQGVPAGKTQITLKVMLEHSWGSPYTLNQTITRPDSTCGWLDTESAGLMTCNIGLIDCFTRQVCDASLNVTSIAALCPLQGLPGSPPVYVPCYNYGVNVSGGSGNFSYYWSVYNENGWQHSTTSTFNFYYQLKGLPIVYLYVTDNVTGCTYQWDSWHNPKMMENIDLEIAAKPSIEAFPNPIGPQSMLNVRYQIKDVEAASVALYDLQGRMIQELAAAGSLQAGSHELQTEINVAPGMYFIGLRTNNGLLTQKIVVTD